MSDEAQIVEKARSGDTAAFKSLYDKYGRFVWSVAFRMTYDFDEAEDVAQDVFISAWKSLPGFRGVSAFSTWLYRITVNHTINRVKRRRITKELTDETLRHVLDSGVFMRQNPAAAADELDVEKRLAALLNRLDADRRMAVILREIEGLSYEEIAEATGVPIGTVRSRLARGRKDLEEMAANGG